MFRKVHSVGLIGTAACLVTLVVLLAQARPSAASLAGSPSPEAWPDRRAAARHLAPGQSPEKPLPAGPVTAIPSWSRLVFQSVRDNNWEVYLDDGSSQLRLTLDPAADIHPRLNRGCTRIAFASKRSGNYDIYTMNTDGSGLTRLTFGDKDDVSPSWSPDGTRIAFESYRDGQGEVYVMGADGSNQSRLTTAPGWDGEPAWSPDGTQLAFAAYRDSAYRIWRMDADGSDQTQLSTVPYSEHPSWGAAAKIAFDADGNGDGWQELWTVDPDGSDQALAYDPPEANTDASQGSWSPDGSSVVFSRVSWIYYQGNWYWLTSYLDAWDSGTGSTVRLSSQGEDMFPDWGTADAAPPTSSVSPLPAQSPSPFAVSWSGSDDGPAGLANFDVQVRDGPGGAWTDWLPATVLTTSTYGGAGGHIYYFRSRARDNAGNLEAWPANPDALTTVESQPPATAVQPLAPYSKGEVTVRWGGSDPGGSGIVGYDVQLRDGAGAWTDWQVGTGDTEAPFGGEVGHTYSFRSRGTDGAGNVEPWPPGAGDTSTTFYVWSVTGTLRDNRHTPVMGGEVGLTPQAFRLVPSDESGAYGAYASAASAEYIVTWEKAGYGGLPATAFGGKRDAHADMVLPPPDNAVLNWGFESGSLEPEWLAGGEISPSATSEVWHTGGFAATLGQATAAFGPWISLSNTGAASCGPALEVDGGGALHAVWWEVANQYQSELYYSRREPGGDWSAPMFLYQTGAAWPDRPQLAVATDGTVHLAWVGISLEWHVLYLNRSPSGAWSGVVNLWTGFPRELDMALGADGAVHLAWSTIAEIMYARRSPSGTWSDVVNLSNTYDWSEFPQVAAGPGGAVHAVWRDRTGGSWQTLYADRQANGTWSSPVTLGNCEAASAPTMEAAGDGSVHVAWPDDSGDCVLILYARRSAGGTWSDPVDVSGNTVGWGTLPQLALGPDGLVHLVWGSGSVVYARQEADADWSAPEILGGGQLGMLAVDSAGAAHLIWSKGPNADEEVYYARRPAGGAWSVPANLSGTPGTYSLYARLAIDPDDGVHAVWQDGGLAAMAILYAGPATAAETGDSILSQALTVPPAASSPTLSFWYRLEGTPLPGGAWLAVQVDDGGTVTDLFASTEPGDWAHAWADLTPWAGEAVTLRFLTHQTVGKPAAWASLDEVSVGSAYPDLWVDKVASQPTVSPGALVEFTLSYGNRGGAGASQAVLTDTLPAGLPFVSADPPPTTLTPFLTWSVGDLPAGSGPLAITLVAGPAPGSGTLTNTADIGSASAELETLNNRAQAAVAIGRRVMLPILLRHY